MNPRQLLLIEDDQTIAELLAYNLRHAGYDVLCESDGRAGLTAALSCDIDLLILDLMIPEIDGVSVSIEIASQKPDLPIIMLTAKLGRESMLEGFAAGADDYITKPFDLDELLARVAARLRRTDSGPVKRIEPVVIDSVVIDPDSHMLTTAAGRVYLKPKEYALLEMLLSSPGRLFRREEIAHRVWHQNYTPRSRTLDVHIRQLRAKLEEVSAPVVIENMRGVGYRIVSVNDDVQ